MAALLLDALLATLTDLGAGLALAIVIAIVVFGIRQKVAEKRKREEAELKDVTEDVEPAFQFKLERRPAPIAETDFSGKTKVGLDRPGRRAA